MVKETGIIMSGNHPRLILEGLKTMTRRTWGLKQINETPDNWIWLEGSSMVKQGRFTFHNDKEDSILVIKCPYGKVGDRLWVRETWASENRYNHLKPSEIPRAAKIFYLTDGYDPFNMGKVRSPLFMPRWASRITLEITQLGAERLQKITVEDCKAEGIKKHISEFAGMTEERNPIYSYELLWDSLNAKRGYGWDKNNWVWPISFKKLEEET